MAFAISAGSPGAAHRGARRSARSARPPGRSSNQSRTRAPGSVSTNPGHHRVHGDAGLRDHLGERERKAEHAGLGRGVRQHRACGAGDAADAARDSRRHVDDPAVAARFHVRHRRRGSTGTPTSGSARSRWSQISSVTASISFAVALAAAAGVVDEDVDRAVCLRSALSIIAATSAADGDIGRARPSPSRQRRATAAPLRAPWRRSASASTSRAPSAAQRSATARPMPCAAPVAGGRSHVRPFESHAGRKQREALDELNTYDST